MKFLLKLIISFCLTFTVTTGIMHVYKTYKNHQIVKADTIKHDLSSPAYIVRGHDTLGVVLIGINAGVSSATPIEVDSTYVIITSVGLPLDSVYTKSSYQKPKAKKKKGGLRDVAIGWTDDVGFSSSGSIPIGRSFSSLVDSTWIARHGIIIDSQTTWGDNWIMVDTTKWQLKCDSISKK